MEVRVLPASSITTAGIGGVCRVFFPKSVDELRSIVEGENFYVLGGGSNIICSNFPGKIAVSLEKFRDIEFDGGFLKLGAGVKLREVISLQMRKGFRLFEFLAGIPRATVGGLVAQNAGAYGFEVKDFLEEVKFFDLSTGDVVTLRDFSKFGYRSSPFPESGIVLSATFKFDPCSRREIRRQVALFVEKRLRFHPPFYLKTAGSTFKNPPGDSAGRLLDLVGMKGFGVGGVKFSEVHANFLINEGGSFEEFMELVSIAKDRVRRAFGLELELEVKLLT